MYIKREIPAFSRFFLFLSSISASVLHPACVQEGHPLGAVFRCSEFNFEVFSPNSFFLSLQIAHDCTFLKMECVTVNKLMLHVVRNGVRIFSA